MILLRCLMVQKAMQYVYIAKCLSFMVSTEKGDYYETTEAEKEKQESEGKMMKEIICSYLSNNEVTVCF